MVANFNSLKAEITAIQKYIHVSFYLIKQGGCKRIIGFKRFPGPTIKNVGDNLGWAKFAIKNVGDVFRVLPEDCRKDLRRRAALGLNSVRGGAENTRTCDIIRVAKLCHQKCGG
jgi:hypothetical protein